MPAKFKNKYRIESARLPSWDYGWAGAYFITICTKNRVHYFGHVADGKTQLSPIGALADVFWHEIKNHAKNVRLGEFIVMPNHIHGILILDGDDRDVNRDVGRGVETRHALSLPGQKRFQNQGKNTVSSIIGGYKSAVTKHARRLGFEFGWLPRFWDYVIRNEGEYRRITQYIINNPKKWEKDKLNGGPGNLVLEPEAEYGEESWMI